MGIPVFKKVTQKDLRNVISKKLNKLGKFYSKFKGNRLPKDFLPKIEKLKTDPVGKYWDIKKQKDYEYQELQAQLLSLNNSNSKTETENSKAKPRHKDNYPGLPLIMSKVMIRRRGKMAKEFKTEMDGKNKLRQNVSQDLEQIEKENPVFAMNYDQAERAHNDQLFHVEKRCV